MTLFKITLFLCSLISFSTFALADIPEKGNFIILVKSPLPNNTLTTALAATPGLIKVESFPVLSSYVLNVKNVATARSYLENLAREQKSIYRVERLLPSTPELDVSPTAVDIRTYHNPYGTSWWTRHTELKPVTVAIWDGGVDIQHPALKHVKAYCQPVDETNPDTALCAQDLASAHGTSLAGIYASTLDYYPGIASYPASRGGVYRDPGNIKNFLIAEAEGPDGIPLQGLDWMLSAGHPRFQVANYSYGNGNLSDTELGCSSNSYSALAEVFDLAVIISDSTIVKSAGNNKYSATRCTLTLPSDAYNIIPVANINPFDWNKCVRGGDRKHDKIHEGSSVNAPYEQDSRRLLLATAPGRYIHTAGLNPQYCQERCTSDDCIAECDSFGTASQGTDNGFWRISTGTSMSTAMVGAVAALLAGAEVDSSEARKAIIINSLDSWTSSNKPHPISPDINPQLPNCSDENARFHHPLKGSHYDRSYGYGVLNADTAYQQRENYLVDYVGAGEVKEYIGSLEDFEKATLVWHKDYAQPLNVLHFTLKYRKNGKWVELMTDRSPVDNTKQVSNGSESLKIPPVDAEVFLLQVLAEKIVGEQKQRFALATAQPFIPK